MIDGSNGDDIAKIPVCSRDGTIKAYAIVDAADFGWVNQWTWRLSNKGYVVRGTRVGGVRQVFRLHREILGLKKDDGLEGDHINRDKLDCRRANLRALPEAGRPNSQNRSSKHGGSSMYRGVHWHKKNQKWVAHIRVDGKLHYLGSFDTELAANAAGQQARSIHFPYSNN